MGLILASSSPRRKEILGLLGIEFETVDPGIEERFDSRRSAPEEALHWATQKARAVAFRRPGSFVIGSDTLIDCEGQKFGKPADHEDAFRILKNLAGRTHTVVTAVAAVFPDGTERKAVERTAVRMRKVPESDLARYAATPDPMDKAGAYSIQGEAGGWVDRIEGDYLAVVGLPLRPVAGFLAEGGISIPVDVEAVYRERVKAP